MEDLIKARLKDEIKNCHLSTVELSKAVGVSPEMITQYCTTNKLPRLDTFARLCSALDVSSDYILGLKNDL